MDYVLLQCIKEKGKLRVKMISSQPFIKGINCQFPRDIRTEGMYYIVKSPDITLRGKFYSAMGKNIIVCSTFDINEVKVYVNNLFGANEKIKPARIFGDDDGSECVVCMYDAKDSIFSPCGHFITCGDCALMCKKCPLCAKNVTCILNRNEIAD
jgi:hypothetical protein